MPRIYTPSKYQPIWDALKSQGKVSLVAFPILHKRIRKAVIKRKDEDLGFKLMLSESFKYSILHIVEDGNTITFELKYYSTFDLGAF